MDTSLALHVARAPLHSLRGTSSRLTLSEKFPVNTLPSSGSSTVYTASSRRIHYSLNEISRLGHIPSADDISQLSALFLCRTAYLGAMASLDPMLVMLENFPGVEASHGAYNCTGKRLATITDGIIRIMALDARGGWALEEGGEIRSGQRGVLWKAAWADVKFGALLATCSQDGTIKIWEDSGRLMAEARGDVRWHTSAVRWHTSATISTEYSVYGVRFAPFHLGLKFAAALGDGTVRIYDSTDSAEHAHWPQQESLGDREGRVICLDWLSSEMEETPMMVLGNTSGKVQIWRRGGDGSTPAWQKTVELPGHGLTTPVVDVAWAPWMGTKNQRVASCGNDGRVQLHLLGKKGATHGEVGGEWVHARSIDLDVGASDENDGELLFSQVRRLSWDCTGARLMSSGRDMMVHVWAATTNGEWVCIDKLTPDADGSSEPAGVSTAIFSSNGESRVLNAVACPH